MFGRNCRSPAEHDEHRRKEAALYNSLFRQPISYSVIIPVDSLPTVIERSIVIREIAAHLSLAEEVSTYADSKGSIEIPLSREEWDAYWAEKEKLP